jgi:hypothetical protein
MTTPNHGTRRTTAHLLYVVQVYYSVLYREMSRGALCAVVVMADSDVPKTSDKAYGVA